MSLKENKIALIIIDMQKDFLEKNSPLYAKRKVRIIPRIKRLLEYFRQKSFPVFHVITLHKPDKSDWTLIDRKLDRAYCIEGARGAEIIDELKPIEGEEIIVKRRYNGFYKTDLEKKLREKNISILVICGISADGCVRATAIGAFDRDFIVIIPEDCIESRDELAYTETIKYFRKSIGYVMPSIKLIKLIEENKIDKLDP